MTTALSESPIAPAQLALIKANRPARSAIFDCDEDYCAYQPYGLYAQRAVLQNYFRARQWLSRMSLPLTDSADDTRAGGSNTFRRSVLLFSKPVAVIFQLFGRDRSCLKRFQPILHTDIVVR